MTNENGGLSNTWKNMCSLTLIITFAFKSFEVCKHLGGGGMRCKYSL